MSDEHSPHSNDHVHSNVVIDDRTFDRLVDGELSSDEYRKLILALEEGQDGWRRCALAFLEAQALGQAMPSVLETPYAEPTAAASKPITPTPQSAASSSTDDLSISLRRAEHWAALAVGILLVFVLGWQFASWTSPAVPGGAIIDPSSMANRNTPKPDREQPFPGIGNAAEPQDAAPQHTLQKPKFVYVNQWDGQNSTGIPIPVDPTRSFDPDNPWDESWGMSDDQLSQWQQDGHALEKRNCWIPVSLDSGEQVVVPMQEVIFYQKPELPFH